MKRKALGETATTRQESVEDFLSQRRLALAGSSRSGRKFGNPILEGDLRLLILQR